MGKPLSKFLFASYLDHLSYLKLFASYLAHLIEPASLKNPSSLIDTAIKKLTWLRSIVCYYPDHQVRYLHIWISKFRSSVKSCKFPISTCCRLSCIICWSRCVRQSLRIPTEPLIPLLPLTCSSGSRSFLSFSF